MAGDCFRIQPSSSMPSSRQFFENGSTGNSTFCAIGQRERLRRQIDLHLRVRQASANSFAWTSGGTTIGSSEFFSEFCLKISAKRRADHGAETELRERPRSVLARAAAAEVIARQQDLRALRRAAYSG